MRKALVLPVILLLLTGCIMDQKNDAHNAPQNGGTVQVNVPKADPVDKDGIADATATKVIADNRNIQQQMSGLVTTSMDKIADVFKGIEAHFNASFSNAMTAMLKIQTDIQSNINLNTELKVKLENQIAINNEMRADLKLQVTATNEMKMKVEALSQATAAVSAQAGLLNEIKNQITTMNSSAGRDVNMLPQAAVDLLISNIHMAVIIILIIVLFFSVGLILAYKYARKREADRTQTERQERMELFELLKEALLHVDPEKRETLQRFINKAKPPTS